MFYKHHGIFAEINKTNAALIIQKHWRNCRYNPYYSMCEKVTTNNLKNIIESSLIKFQIEFNYNDDYYKIQLRKKQENFREELSRTRLFLEKRNKMKAFFANRIKSTICVN